MGRFNNGNYVYEILTGLKYNKLSLSIADAVTCGDLTSLLFNYELAEEVVSDILVTNPVNSANENSPFEITKGLIQMLPDSNSIKLAVTRGQCSAVYFEIFNPINNTATSGYINIDWHSPRSEIKQCIARNLIMYLHDFLSGENYV